MSAAGYELSALKEALKENERVTLTSCFAQSVRASIVATPLHSLAVSFHFPETYPEEALSAELSSATLEADLLAKMPQARRPDSNSSPLRRPTLRSISATVKAAGS